jgi:hypothetical protein
MGWWCGSGETEKKVEREGRLSVARCQRLVLCRVQQVQVPVLVGFRLQQQIEALEESL